MAMPDFIKKKIDAKAKKSAEEASASDEDASESASDAPVKKGGKMNPLMMWAAKNK